MKNYYAILEVPVGCGVAEISQAYRRLVQENLDNEPISADLREAHEVLTTPARRADYDRAVWGETFPDGGGQEPAPALDGATLLPGGLPPSAPGVGPRCPMRAEAQCPVLLGRTGPADTYCPECGYLLAALSSADGPDQPGAANTDESARLEEPGGKSHRLRLGLNMVGRESADVLLPDKTVSRQHARLEVGEDGIITVEDLSSTNGTQVGGDVLVPHVPRTVQSGDRVRFGSVVTELHLSPAALAPNPGGAGEEGPVGELLAAPSSPAPNPALLSGAAAPESGSFGMGAGGARAQVVETREEGGRTFPLLPGVTTFGRRADNSCIIQGDPYVSGSHAQIIADGDLFRLTDIGSTNGTLLNGRRLVINEPETLSPGDVILIGGTAMRFEPLEMSEEDAAEKDVFGEGVMVDAEETKALLNAPGTGPEDAHAEPRERTAQEYDVPDDFEDNGIPTRAATPHTVPKRDDGPKQDDSPKQDSPTNVER